jgi:NADH-quinone oxidoreductase subunit J
MSAVLMGGFRVSEEPHATAALGKAGVEISNTREVGKLLYTRYLYPLEVAAAILLVGMIAAIALTLRHRKDSRAIDPGVQVRVKSKDRMVVVKVVATKPALPVEASDATPGESKA